jgi:hypothetical protein
VKQHLVRSQILGDNIVSISRNDGQAHEKVKVIGEIVSPTCLPYPNGDSFGEFTFEASVSGKT